MSMDTSARFHGARECDLYEGHRLMPTDHPRGANYISITYNFVTRGLFITFVTFRLGNDGSFPERINSLTLAKEGELLAVRHGVTV